MLNKISTWIARHPIIIVIICASLLVPSAVGYFNTFVNYDILTYLPEDLESVQGQTVLDETFHMSASSFVILDNMQSKDVQKVKEKIAEVENIRAVVWVDDIVDITVPEEFLPDALRDIFYSEDGNSTMLMVMYDHSSASAETMKALSQVKHIVGSNVLISGLSAVAADTKELSDSQAGIYIALAVALALVALSLTMTSWILPLVLLTALGVAVVYNMGTNFMFGQISFLTQCIAAILQLGVTMDYSVFLMDRYEEELRHNPVKKEAMAKAISSTFLSLTSSSLTTVFGFLALCFMSFTLGLDIGLVMAKGVVFGVIVVVTLLPALILLLDKPIAKLKHRSFLPHFDRINKFILNRKVIMAVVCFALVVPSILARNNVSMYYNMTDAMPQDLPSLKSSAALAEKFNMSTLHFAILGDDVPASEVEKMTQEMGKVDGVTGAISLNSIVGPAIPLDVIPDSIKAICIKDGKQLMMINSELNSGTDECNTQIDTLTQILKKYDAGGMLTGESVLTKDLVDVTAHDFTVTSIISIAAIFLLIAICFKSLSIPIILVAVIELAIMMNLACSFLFGEELSFIAPTIIGCVQLGATVDYAILLTTRFREELRRGHDKAKAMRISLNESGRSIVQSALVFFSATFGVYVVCDIEIIKSICLLLARGSVISALVIAFFLAPILLLSESLINKTTLNWRSVKESKDKNNDDTEEQSS